MNWNQIRVLIQQRLVALGWTGTPYTAVASKTFLTAVGERVAHAYVYEWGKDAPQGSLVGDYWSEGRNCLEPHAVLFPKDGTEEVIRQAVDDFATKVDAVVSQTYAARLLRQSASPD